MDAIRIALCDPVKRDMLSLLRQILCHQSQKRFQFFAFTDPNQLLTCAGAYDVVFLYVDTAAPDGLAVARKLRACEKAPAIILMAKDATHAPAAFPVAMRYLCKPLADNLVREAIDAAVLRLTWDRISLKCGREFCWVFFRDILCLTTEKNYVYVHTDQRDYRVRGCLQTYGSRLPSDQFLSCSRGVVINLNRVSCIEGETVILDDQSRHTISTGKRKSFISQYRMFCANAGMQNSPERYVDLPPDTDLWTTEPIPEKEAEPIFEHALRQGNKLWQKMKQPPTRRMRSLLLTLGISAVLLVLISREAGAKWIPDIRATTTTQKEYTTIELTWPEHANPGSITGRELLNEPYDPLKGILPEGYRLREGIARRENVKYAIYIDDGTGLITYDVSRASGTSDIDTENAEVFYEMEFNGHWAFFVQKNGYLLVWVNQETMTYHGFFANELELEEFMEIADILSQSDKHE